MGEGSIVCSQSKRLTLRVRVDISGAWLDEKWPSRTLNGGGKYNATKTRDWQTIMIYYNVQTVSFRTNHLRTINIFKYQTLF